MIHEQDPIITDLAFSDFGGRNKARRLAKLVAKGKGNSAKAQKLQAKVQAKVDKLAAKGKVNSKRYTFLTNKLKNAATPLTDDEEKELDGIQNEVEKDDPALKKELADETGDAADDATDATASKTTTTARFLGMPKTIGIIVTVTSSLLILGTVAFFVLRHHKKA